MNKKTRGFTLIEILVALFIFTILSMLLVAALRGVIDANERTEIKAERLRNLQMALLVMSRDIEQTVNRPILDASGKEEAAFLGDETGFTFTHAGVGDALSSQAHSSLQRGGYRWNDPGLYRISWGGVLDQAPTSKAHNRILLEPVASVQFSYLDQEGHLQKEWPSSKQSGANETLPRAVQMQLTLSHWGSISALFLIPTQAIPQGGADAKR